ncbi:hypothetical protein L2744_15015, partial [Shewanella profunda]|uniref:hypothetical protein n=1 Tax=Shewanella profunda TaxID=254793 RepID=UPI00200CDA8F
MKTSEILKVSSIDDLKGLGSYLEIKRFLEEKVDNKLGAKGWSSLFFKIQGLKGIICTNKETLLSSIHKNSFEESKVEISKILGIKMRLFIILCQVNFTDRYGFLSAPQNGLRAVIASNSNFG